jgi:hypothetical protein
MTESEQQDKLLAPLEQLPPELAQKVAADLSIDDLKSLRLSTRHMRDKVAEQTFQKITLASTRHSIDHLSILPAELRDYIQHVVFDISCIYAKHETPSDPNQLAADCCATYPDGTPFLTEIQFLTDFALLKKVRKITITTFDRGTRARDRGVHHIDEDVLFHQILHAIQRLKQPISDLSMTAQRIDTLTFDMFSGRNEEPSDATRENVADMQGQSPLPVLRTLRHLNLQLYYGSAVYRESASANLHNALDLMSDTLETLRIAILAHGYRGRGGGLCLDHNHWNHDYARSCSFSMMLQDIRFKALKIVHMHDVPAGGSDIGRFLAQHAHCLKEFRDSSWSCSYGIHDAVYLQELVTAAGDALDLLTVEWSSGVKRMQCEAADSVYRRWDWLRQEQRDAQLWLSYNKVSATILNNLLLVDRISHVAAHHALSFRCHTDSNTFEHFDFMDYEYPKHLDHLSQLSASELAIRGRWTEQVLQEYCTYLFTNGYGAHRVCNHTWDEFCEGRPCTGNSEFGPLIVLAVSGELGLYRWHRERKLRGKGACSLQKWDYAVNMLTFHQTGNVVLEPHKSWCHTAETDFLDEKIDARYKNVPGLPEAPVPIYPMDKIWDPSCDETVWYDPREEYCAGVFEDQGLEAMADIARRSKWFVLPEVWEIKRTFYHDIGDLAQKREQRLRQVPIDEAERSRIAEEEYQRRVRKYKNENDWGDAVTGGWGTYHAPRRSSRQVRRSRRHWAWVARRSLENRSTDNFPETDEDY